MSEKVFLLICLAMVATCMAMVATTGGKEECSKFAEEQENLTSQKFPKY